MTGDREKRDVLQFARQLALLFDASYNGIVITDREGRIWVYNKAAMPIFNDTVSPVGIRMSQLRPEMWPDIKRILVQGLRP